VFSVISVVSVGGFADRVNLLFLLFYMLADQRAAQDFTDAGFGQGWAAGVGLGAEQGQS